MLAFGAKQFPAVGAALGPAAWPPPLGCREWRPLWREKREKCLPSLPSVSPAWKPCSGGGCGLVTLVVSASLFVSQRVRRRLWLTSKALESVGGKLSY